MPDDGQPHLEHPGRCALADAEAKVHDDDTIRVDLPKTAAPIMKYAERIFSRPAYIEALTPSEKVMRK